LTSRAIVSPRSAPECWFCSASESATERKRPTGWPRRCGTCGSSTTPRAARPEAAEPLYDRFCERLGAKKGVFGACMGVALVNDGPVTVMVEIPPASEQSA
jgi:hypothetical protein